MLKRSMLLLVVVLGLGACASAGQNSPVEVKILAINDFHGNLKPPGTLRIADPSDSTKTINVNAGGMEYLATLVRTLRAKNPNTVIVAAGDLIGASPLLSSLFKDEPTIEALDMLGLDFTSVGNHEFDEGRDELLRMQNGGCHPVDGCRNSQRFEGAKFKYLAANVVDTKTGKTLFPPYQIRSFNGIPVAFIGMTLKSTPAVVIQAGVAGLDFRDEADTVNRLVPELKAQGVEAIVVLHHGGGVQSGDYNECKGISGVFVDIVKQFDKAVDVVVSGHSHAAYNCTIDGRLVTSASSFGRVLTEIDLKLDPRTRDVIAMKAENTIVRSDIPKDPDQSALIERVSSIVGPLENRVVGAATAKLDNSSNSAGESSLGDIIADAMLEATQDASAGKAQIAFMNAGGVRAPITPVAGRVTYGQIFATQPFGNSVLTISVFGSDIHDLLEQQWAGANERSPRVLQVSSGFSYTWDAAKPAGQRVDPASIRLKGAAVVAGDRYWIAVNDFIAQGGDNFTVLTRGTDQRGWGTDVDLLEKYFSIHVPVAPGPQNRIRRVN